MRVVLELILAAAIIALAWEKPLQERASELPWIGDKVAPVVKKPDHPRSSIESPASRSPAALRPNPRPVVTPAPTTPASWMWDPNRKSILDAKPKTTTTSPGPSSGPDSWLWDPKHKSPLDPPATKHPESTPKP